MARQSPGAGIGNPGWRGGARGGLQSVSSCQKQARTRRRTLALPVTRDQELWAMALWVEKTRGEDGWLYIAEQQDRFLAEGDFDGMKLWRQIGQRFEQLGRQGQGTLAN